jgi:hypothetical protein
MGNRQYAGAYCLSVNMHGTGAALPKAATELGSGHPEHVPHDPQQRHIVRDVDALLFTIDSQISLLGHDRSFQD